MKALLPPPLPETPRSKTFTIGQMRSEGRRPMRKRKIAFAPGTVARQKCRPLRINQYKTAPHMRLARKLDLTPPTPLLNPARSWLIYRASVAGRHRPAN
jgi:hypothetical protein